ncbi:MAG: hypothetical protein ABSD03_14805 [Vulcanimicrobiaceae bacterium]|jgi:hypothetical protein
MLDAEAVVRGTLLAAVVVVLLAAGLQIVRALRGLLRIRARLVAHAGSPAATALAQAQRDVARLQAARAACDLLLARAQAALATIRRGPLPPGVVALLARLRAELAAFNASARR